MSSKSQTLRSRMHAEPRGRRLEITPRDLAIFALLDRYRYLPANFIHAFVGGHASYHKARLTDLFHEGWLRKPARQWEAMNARYRFDTYELDARAVAELAERQLLSTNRLGTGNAFRHELMVCQVMASFELAAAAAGIAMLGWKDVLAGAPEGTRDSATPFAIPMTFEHRGRRSDRPLRPDGHPFGLASRRSFWFPGIELDRHSEPLHPTDLASRNSSILAKLLQYRQMIRQRLFASHYGMANMMVPVVTINAQHMHNMIDLVLDLSDGRGFRWMLFKTVADFASLEKTVRPELGLLTEPWRRAGHPPLNLLEELTHES